MALKFFSSYLSPTAFHRALRPTTMSKKGSKKQPTISTEGLIQKAQDAVDQFDFEKAQRLCAKAVQQSPMNVVALELMAAVQLELGLPDKALERLRKCIAIQPNTGYSKYLTMGELHQGKQALGFFQKGVEILKAEKEKNPDDAVEYNRRISSALCSVTDLYLTDLCFEEDAEQRCCALLDEAIQIDAMNPEVYQVYASVRISQCNPDDARAMMQKSLGIWFEKEQARRARLVKEGGEGDEEDGEEEMQQEKGEDAAEEEEEEDTNTPPYDFRINTAKILVELEETLQASQVLEMLLGEDDEVVEVWYLLGYVYVLLKERKAAEDTLKTAKKLFKKFQCDDEGIFQHIEELLEECNALEYKPGDQDDDGEDNDDMEGGEGNEGEWEDVDDDDEEGEDMES